MSRAQEICERNELISLVRQVAKLWGETDEAFWKEYVAEVLKGDREKNLECFRGLLEQAKWIFEGKA